MDLRGVLLGVVIAILTLSVVVFGVNTLYPRAEWNDYCSDVQREVIIDEAQCSAAGGEWTPSEIKCISPESCPTGYCDLYVECSQEFEDAQESRALALFLILLPVSLIIIFLGFHVFKLDTVGFGLLLGGIFSLLYGTWGFFWSSNNFVRFILSLVALILVVWLAHFIASRHTSSSRKKMPSPRRSRTKTSSRKHSRRLTKKK